MEIPTSLSELGGLAIVATDALLLHEAHDPARLERLRGRIAAEGIQGNPITASGVSRPGLPNAFLVLDGAHRAEALRSVGCRFALVQLVELPEYADGWRHLVGVGGTGVRARFEEALSGRGGVSDAPGGRTVARVGTASGDFTVVASGNDVAGTLRAMQGAYPKGTSGVVRRLAEGEEVEPEDGEAVVAYAPIPTAEIVAEISAGRTLPAGVTRFRVPGRILGVGMPLDLLQKADDEPASLWLSEKIGSHLKENRIRRYEEPVTLFE